MIKQIRRILVVLVVLTILLTVQSNAFTVQITTDKNEIEFDNEFIYTIKLDENVIAANFDINYNSSLFELIGSSTNGLDVASKEGKVSCIYADIEGKGTNSFQIRFIAKNRQGQATFSISDAKFRGVNEDSSYINSDITGLTTQNSISVISNSRNNNSNTNIVNDNTLSQDNLPKTGTSSVMLFVVLIFLAIAIIFKIKFKKIKNLLPIILAIVILGNASYNVQALANNLTIDFIEVNSNNLARIIISNSNRSITKSELMNQNREITSIKNEEQREIENRELVRTGYIIETNNGLWRVSLIGDANKDGYICDTDDLMIIINSHLGKKTPSDIEKISANLDDRNDLLDIQDILEMKNVFLGQKSIELSNNTSNTPTTPEIPNQPAEPSQNSKTLVVYYSAQSHTKAVAEKIANNLNADIFEIVPDPIYTSEDLNYSNSNSRVSREHDDESLRNVKLEKDTVDNWNEYDTVLIGYPIWWGISAWPVNTFVKANDFNGKTVIPFCTSTSSGLGQSGELLERDANGGNWLEGHRFTSNASDSDIKAWTDSLN